MVKNPPVSSGDTRDTGSIPGSEGFPGGGNGHSLQYSCPENPHGQRSLAGCSLWGRRLGHDLATKCVCVCAYTPTHPFPGVLLPNFAAT